jgi:hypothetical protein
MRILQIETTSACSAPLCNHLLDRQQITLVCQLLSLATITMILVC